MPDALKEEAHRLIDTLPDGASWDDLMDHLYVRQAVEQGLADSDAGRTTTVGEIHICLDLFRAARSEKKRVGNPIAAHPDANMLKGKLAVVSITFTIAIMLLAIQYIIPKLEEFNTNFIIVNLASILVSLGIYKGISNLLLWIFGKSIFVRMIFLGRGFLEGTWIGHYKEGNENRFTVEFIDQSEGDTIIHGREFFGDGKTRASWTTDTVSVDTRKLILMYAYTARVFERKHVQEGLGVFSIIRESRWKYPKKLDGYAVDLIDGDRDPNTEYKISNTPITDDEALEKAREKFI